MAAIDKAIELLQKVLEENYKLSEGYEIKPETRDEIERWLKWYNDLQKRADGISPTSENKLALPLKRISFSETNNICPHCGKYKRLQGNGVIHQLCECGSEAEVCSHEFELEEAWVHKCIKCGEIQIEYKEQT